MQKLVKLFLLVAFLWLSVFTTDTETNVDTGEDDIQVVTTADDDPAYDDLEDGVDGWTDAQMEEDVIFDEGDEGDDSTLEEDDEMEDVLESNSEDDKESNLYDEEDAQDEKEEDVEELQKDLEQNSQEDVNEEKDAYMGYDDDTSRYSHLQETEEEILDLERELKAQDEYFEQMDDDEVDIVIMDDSRQEMLETMIETTFTVEINDKVGLDGKKWQIYKMPEDGALEMLNLEDTFTYKHELFPSQYDKDDRSVRYRFKLKSHQVGLFEVILVYGHKHDLDLYRERHRGTLKDGRISRTYPKKELMIRVVDHFDYEGDGLSAEDLAYAHEELQYKEDL
eukprot:CAMPEP_0115029782 /NCGR_PEP_ID=MMETSP0216-20121206/37257_1 /TAXON_ID=223996 /ORGANISM="Protocruzia adherens, Strain Boccale" /LENGTH=336 /DNA_ID=CAMNT_0002406535 /DNA_START=1 /DNA_END=1011 /DNA_ORIENTATION=-